MSEQNPNTWIPDNTTIDVKHKKMGMVFRYMIQFHYILTKYFYPNYEALLYRRAQLRINKSLDTNVS